MPDCRSIPVFIPVLALPILCLIYGAIIMLRGTMQGTWMLVVMACDGLSLALDCRVVSLI